MVWRRRCVYERGCGGSVVGVNEEKYGVVACV